MKVFILFINFVIFVHIVPSFGLARQSVDGDHALDFDSRFVRRMDLEDVSPTQQFETAQVTFPTQDIDPGIIVLPSTTSTTPAPTFTSVTTLSFTASTSASVTTASSAPSTTTSVATSTSQSACVSPPPCTSSCSTSHSTKNKAPIIVGSILATLFILAILSMLIVFLIKRKRRIGTRFSFYRDMMVRTQPPPTMAKRTPSSTSAASSSTPPSQRDIEQGLHTLILARPSKKKQPSQVLEPPHITPFPFSEPITRPERSRRPPVTRLQLDLSHRPPPPGAPTGPRSPLHRLPRAMSPGLRLPRSPLPRSPLPRSPLPRTPLPQSPISRSHILNSPILRSPSPRTHRQRAIADQIEILRVQMLEFERKGAGDGTVMDEMCKKLAWLREQQEGTWALGLTEVTPLGYERYMT